MSMILLMLGTVSLSNPRKSVVYSYGCVSTYFLSYQIFDWTSIGPCQLSVIFHHADEIWNHPITCDDFYKYFIVISNSSTNILSNLDIKSFTVWKP